MRSSKRRFGDWIGLICLALVGLFLAAPFLWMVLVSLHPSRAPIPMGLEVIPKEPNWQNYGFVLFMPELPVARFFFNSVFVCAVVVVGQLIVTSLAAFALSRLKFKGRDTVFGLFLASMMFAGTVTQIPVFLMMREVGWLNTYAALIVPALSSSFSVFLLRQFFLQIPFELDEAARMDGATDLAIWWKVTLPLGRPALAAAGAFCFFAVWTDFFWPLLSTSSVDMRTLEVGLSVFKNSYGGTNWPLQMTAAMIVLAPSLLVFILLQKHFIKGISAGAVKE